MCEPLHKIPERVAQNTRGYFCVKVRTFTVRYHLQYSIFYGYNPHIHTVMHRAVYRATKKR